MKKDNNNRLKILVQGFYGNRTVTEINKEDFDSFMLGHIGKRLLNPDKEKVDRTIVRVPGAENLVIIYNKYEEEKCLCELQEFVQNLKRSEDRFNPSVVIPEKGIVLYSRCIVCRMNAKGEFESLEKDDFKLFMKYMAQ